MIHSLRVRNFKSLLDVQVSLEPVTVFVGKSGAGKSNLVESLRCLREVLLASNRVRQTWSAIRPAAGGDEPTSFEVEFSIRALKGRFRYRLALPEKFSSGSVHEELLEFRGKTLFHQVRRDPGDSLPVWIVAPESGPQTACGPPALRSLATVSEARLAFTVLTTGLGWHAFSDGVFQSTNEERSNDGLSDDGANYLEVVKNLANDLERLDSRENLVAALRRLNATVNSIELDDPRNPKSLVVAHRFDGRTLALPLIQESAGLRRVYAHLLALHQRPAKQTLVFEHPEDGIHPGALQLLAEEFQMAPDDGRGQVLLTTHSPRLLDHFQPEQIRMVERVGLATRAGPLASEQRESLLDGPLSPGELLTVDPARRETGAAEAPTP